MTIETNEYSFDTRAVHAGTQPDPSTSAVIPPISLSTTFSQLKPGQPGKYEYSRSANPNRDQFESAVASLENATTAIATSSGSAATALIILALPQNSHIISCGDIYGGTHRYFTKVAPTRGIKATLVNSLETELPSAFKSNTSLVWLETPSNPTLSITSIRKVANIIKSHNESTDSNVILIVDNTFLSPYISNPLSLGADVVVHSVTKYLNGHSDVVMGVIATNSPQLAESYRFLQNAIGSIPSPFDSWLAHRGLKTLHLRVKQASQSAHQIAEYLLSHPQVIHVNYPGLPSHPNHAVVLKQHKNGLGGGMISFRIKGGAEAASNFTSSTKLFCLAESLGGIESLIEVPAVMTHGGIPKEQRESVGVFDDLIRVSVGIEDTEDLIRDIENALKHI